MVIFCSVFPFFSSCCFSLHSLCLQHSVHALSWHMATSSQNNMHVIVWHFHINLCLCKSRKSMYRLPLRSPWLFLMLLIIHRPSSSQFGDHSSLSEKLVRYLADIGAVRRASHSCKGMCFTKNPDEGTYTLHLCLHALIFISHIWVSRKQSRLLEKSTLLMWVDQYIRCLLSLSTKLGAQNNSLFKVNDLF